MKKVYSAGNNSFIPFSFITSISTISLPFHNQCHSLTMDDFRDFYGQQTDVLISDQAIEEYATRFLKEHAAEYITSTLPLQFPLQFPSLQEEVNLLALKELLMVMRDAAQTHYHQINYVSTNYVLSSTLLIPPGGRHVRARSSHRQPEVSQ